MGQRGEPGAIGRITTGCVDIEDFAIVSHAVPAERVRPHLPGGLELETFEGEDGRERALVSTTCFCNRGLRWSLSRWPSHDFLQATFRTYVAYDGKHGSYFMATYVGTLASFAGQRAVTAIAHRALFDVDVHRTPEGYPRYRARARGPLGEMSFEVEATSQPEALHPFETGAEHATFITHRLYGFAKSSFGFHNVGHVEHDVMRPWGGRLLRGRFDFWYSLGVLAAEEATDVYSVLVQPRVGFTLHPPRPLLV